MKPMDPFEQQLRGAFRRVEPPPGLEQRILLRVRPQRAQPSPRWLAAAAVAVLVTGGSVGFLRWRQDRLRAKEAERVRQQLALTLDVTARVLARADQRLKSIGVETVRLQEVSQ